jgi:hypothetical protein
MPVSLPFSWVNSFLFPWRRLHLFEAGAHDDIHLLAAKAASGTAAIHGGIAAAEHDNPPADLGDMSERNG